MPEKTEKTVSEDDCKTRRQSIRWMISAGIGLIGVSVMVGGWLGWMTVAACEKAATAQNTVDNYIAKNEERSIAIHQSLERIATNQIRMSDRLDKLINQKGP